MLTSTSLTGIWPKRWIMSDYNYLEDDQYLKYIIQEHDIQTEQHGTIERQIRKNALLSSQLQEEERNQVITSNCQTEYDDPLPYLIDRGQVKLEVNYEPTLGRENKTLVRFDTHQVPDSPIEQEISPRRMPLGYFQEKANLKTGNVTGIYYNTQTTITFHYPQDIFTVHDMKDTRKQPHTNLDASQGQITFVESKTSTPRLDANQLNIIPEQNIERPLINQSQIQYDNRWIWDSTPKIQMTSSEEDWFNESIVTLLSGQQDLQKQSLEMMHNMTRHCEYYNLMRDITIYDGKNMHLADWLLQIEKSGCIDWLPRIWICNSKFD